MKRFNIVSTGYDINEVNKFIDVVINRLEKLNEENNEYLKIIDELKKNSKNKVEEPKEIDNDSLAKALLAAEETSTRMKELAKKEAEIVLDDAKRNANNIIQESLIEASKNEKEAAILKKNIEICKSRVKSILNNQLEIIEDIDKVEI